MAPRPVSVVAPGLNETKLLILILILSNGGGSGSCNLQTYSNTHMKGYNGLKVEVDKGFKSEMDKMNGWAKQCSVTIQITHAFRKEGQNIGGTVVPPGTCDFIFKFYI